MKKLKKLKKLKKRRLFRKIVSRGIVYKIRIYRDLQEIRQDFTDKQIARFFNEVVRGGIGR